MATLAGGAGASVRLKTGQCLRLTNTYGTQVVDTWCLPTADPSEYLSVEHTRRMLGRLFPRQGDDLFSNRRTPLLHIDRDTSSCRHDMLLACCDPWLYQYYKCAPGHANCRDNFLMALAANGIVPSHVPNPVNFWMNVPVEDNDNIALRVPDSKPGDYLMIRALADVVIVMSACPMDITPVNGEDRKPRDVEYEIVDRDG